MILLEETKEKMETSLTYLKNELNKIRAGKANPNILQGLMVDCYGTSMPINQIANLSAPDPRSIVIQPWDKNLIKDIEDAIRNSDLNLNPVNNGELIRINIPILTEERRKDLMKQVKNEGENSKISIRNIRREINEKFKKMELEGLSEDLRHDAEADVQKITDDFIKNIDDIIKQKEEEIMTV